jgi:hypothetical protein
MKWLKIAFIAVMSAFFLGLFLVFVYGMSSLVKIDFYKVFFGIWVIYLADKIYFKVKEAINEND